MSQLENNRSGSLSADVATEKPCKGEAVANLLDGMEHQLDQFAANLYNMASMLVGEGEEALTLVEHTLASPDVTGCCDAEKMRVSSLWALCSGGIKILASRDAMSLASPAGNEPIGSCIDEDDIAAAGIPAEKLEEMISGPGRDRMQAWLETLPVVQRAIFVLRAVVGVCNPNTSKLLRENGGPAAAGWTAETVRQTLRVALCSLATQLLRG